jgi:hypothetical protein
MADKSYHNERWILKVGRATCLLVGALAFAAIVLGAMAVAAGGIWLLAGKPARPAIPDEPLPRTQFSVADAVRLSRVEFQFDETKLVASEVGRATMAAIEPLKSLFPDPAHNSWDDVSQEYCRVPSSMGCLERGRRLMRRGVAGFVGSIVEQLREPDRVAFIELLQRFLPGAPPEQRANLVAPAWIAEAERRNENEKRHAAWQDTVAKMEREHDEAVRKHAAEATLLLSGGGAAAAGGLGAALSICFIVAILAIERSVRRSDSA